MFCFFSSAKLQKLLVTLMAYPLALLQSPGTVGARCNGKIGIRKRFYSQFAVFMDLLCVKAKLLFIIHACNHSVTLNMCALCHINFKNISNKSRNLKGKY